MALECALLLVEQMATVQGLDLSRRNARRVRARKLTTTKNAAKTPQINKRNRLPLSALRCHRDRLSTTILAPFLAVVN